jgi:hypothetical protein
VARQGGVSKHTIYARKAQCSSPSAYRQAPITCTSTRLGSSCLTAAPECIALRATAAMREDGFGAVGWLLHVPDLLCSVDGVSAELNLKC